MTKLVCNFSDFEAKKNKIAGLVQDYNQALTVLQNLETQTTPYWKSPAQKVYYSKFMERKAEVEQLSNTYKDLVSFLETVSKNYKQIESNYQ